MGRKNGESRVSQDFSLNWLNGKQKQAHESTDGEGSFRSTVARCMAIRKYTSAVGIQIGDLHDSDSTCVENRETMYKVFFLPAS